MSVPGYPESGAIPGQQQVQQQPSIDFSGAIPLKKRRFPIIREKSPPPEENKDTKQAHSIIDEGLSLGVCDSRNTFSPANSDVSKTSPITVISEVNPNVQLTEGNPVASLGSLDGLGNKEIIANENSSEPGIVKQEIVTGKTEGTNHQLELSTRKMNVELSLGPKEPTVSVLKQHNSAAVVCKSEQSESSLLSLALHNEKLVLKGKNDITGTNDGNPACANRSNWDLNTTMDVWEGSTSSDAYAHRLVDIGGLRKTNSCPDDKSSLTTEGTVGLLHSDKGKRIMDGNASSFSNVSTQPSQQCKNDDSLSLGLATPCMDTIRERPSLSENIASVSPNLCLKQIQLSLTGVNRTVKSEPVDDNSKRDCSVGSSSSCNMEVLKFSSVKSELANNRNLATVLKSSLSLEKLVDSRSIKFEVVQDHNQGSSNSEDAAILQSAGRIMQHQDSCASSSSLPLSLMQQNPRPPRLPTCSELTASEDLSYQSELSFHGKELNQNDALDGPIASIVSKAAVSQETEQSRQVGSGSGVDLEKHELAQVDEDMQESSKNSEAAANDEEKLNICSEKVEEDALVSDSKPQQCADSAVDAIDDKEDEDYEDGEVREPIQHSAAEDSIPEGKKTERLELAESDCLNCQPSVSMGDQNIDISGLEGNDAVKKNQEETHSDVIKNCVGVFREPNSDCNTSLKISERVLRVITGENLPSPDKQLDFSGKEVRESPGNEVLVDVSTNGSHGICVEPSEATDKVVYSSVEVDSTLLKVEASLDGHYTAKDSNNIGNKSRIINLARASVVPSSKTKSIPNRLLTSRSGKERFSDFDGEVQPRGNRDEFYSGGSNKFVKGRVHDPSHRSSRPNFILGKGRISGRFGSLRGEWDPDHDFSSETSYGPSDYRVIGRKHNSSISDMDLDCNGYGVPQDTISLGRNRRKTMNDEFSTIRRTSLRRLSSGDREVPATRGVQMLHRIPRNMSPRRCSAEAGSDVMGLRQDNKFMRLSDDIVEPVYNRPQVMHDELDDQLVRGDRNFSTLQRKGYTRIRSKSPVRSRTRSPGPWSSPRRRSPNGLPELTQHRSPALYRMGRMRSPDRACFREEMVARRRGSPSYVARHTNDMRDVDSGREHVHTRSADSNRRSSPGRVYPRSTRRTDALESREMGDGEEYMNGPLPSNKFHELRGDGGIDDRRKFIERRGPLRSFRPNYTGENDNFRFHLNDGPRPYRFCPDADAEFVERNNMREREFDGRIKHQPLVRRIRNIEEQQDGNYRPVERVWHDDGFTDGRVKRRRF